MPVLAALLGALIAGLLALVPALHVYNVAGFMLLVAGASPGLLPADALAMFMLGLVTGYAMLNTLPAILLSAPDDTMFLSAPAARRYLRDGRAYEAVLLIGVGSLGGLFVLVSLSPLWESVFVPVRAVVLPHLHWILGLIIVSMFWNEWPAARGKTVFEKFRNAWEQQLAGLTTFVLAGLLGFVLLYRAPLPVTAAYQPLLPAFVGLFAIPGVLGQLLAGSRPPPQYFAHSLDLTPGLLARGVAAGSLGGLFAAFFPVVTGGVGGLLAGHATAQRDDRICLIAQGASKVLYLAGAFLFFFVPGQPLTKGGPASVASTLHAGGSPDVYWLAVASLALSGPLTFFLLLGLAQVLIRLLPRVDHRLTAFGALALLIAVVLWVAGPPGLAVALVAAAIGLIPVFWGAHRMHCLGVLLLPVVLNMAGLGSVVAQWLGLI